MIWSNTQPQDGASLRDPHPALGGRRQGAEGASQTYNDPSK